MIQLLPAILPAVLKRILPDKDQQQQAISNFNELVLSGEIKQFEKRADIIIAEAKSEHVLTSQWRPITMLVFVMIIANNYILAPYLDAIFSWSVELEIPQDLWDLLKIGLGGYVVGRTGEKMVTAYKAK